MIQKKLSRRPTKAMLDNIAFAAEQGWTMERIARVTIHGGICIGVGRRARIFGRGVVLAAATACSNYRGQQKGKVMHG